MMFLSTESYSAISGLFWAHPKKTGLSREFNPSNQPPFLSFSSNLWYSTMQIHSKSKKKKIEIFSRPKRRCWGLDCFGPRWDSQWRELQLLTSYGGIFMLVDMRFQLRLLFFLLFLLLNVTSIDSAIVRKKFISFWLFYIFCCRRCRNFVT